MYSIELSEGFHWTVQINRIQFNFGSDPGLASLPELLNTVTKVEKAISFIESTPVDFTLAKQVSSVLELQEHIKALSALPQGNSYFF